MNKKPDLEALKKSRELLAELDEIGSHSEAFARGVRLQNKTIQVGLTIRKLRIQKGLTQQELAQLAGMSQSDVSRIEAGTGSHGPGIETISRLANALLHHVDLVFRAIDENSEIPVKQASELDERSESSVETLTQAYID